MDDKYLDTLITQASRSRNSEAMPPDDFFASIAAREVMRRRRTLFTRISVAASVCVVAACSLWFFSSSHKGMEPYSAQASALYSESLDNASERIDRLASVQSDLRNSIDQQFPF